MKNSISTLSLIQRMASYLDEASEESQMSQFLRLANTHTAFRQALISELRSLKTAASLSLFDYDDDEEEEKKEPPKPKQEVPKPTPPKPTPSAPQVYYDSYGNKIQPKSPQPTPAPQQQAPSKPVPSAPAPQPEAPASPSAQPSETAPSTPADAGKWKLFLKTFYDGGKKKVPNTNPKTKGSWPQVAMSYLIQHDKAFHAQIMKEYEAWLAQEEEAPASAPSSKKIQLPQTKYTGVASLQDFKPGDTFWEAGHPDKPLTVKVVVKNPYNGLALVGDKGIPYYEDEVLHQNGFYLKGVAEEEKEEESPEEEKEPEKEEEPPKEEEEKEPEKEEEPPKEEEKEPEAPAEQPETPSVKKAPKKKKFKISFGDEITSLAQLEAGMWLKAGKYFYKVTQSKSDGSVTYKKFNASGHLVTSGKWFNEHHMPPGVVHIEVSDPSELSTHTQPSQTSKDQPQLPYGVPISHANQLQTGMWVKSSLGNYYKVEKILNGEVHYSKYTPDGSYINKGSWDMDQTLTGVTHAAPPSFSVGSTPSSPTPSQVSSPKVGDKINVDKFQQGMVISYSGNKYKIEEIKNGKITYSSWSSWDDSWASPTTTNASAFSGTAWVVEAIHDPSKPYPKGGIPYGTSLSKWTQFKPGMWISTENGDIYYVEDNDEDDDEPGVILQHYSDDGSPIGDATFYTSHQISKEFTTAYKPKNTFTHIEPPAGFTPGGDDEDEDGEFDNEPEATESSSEPEPVVNKEPPKGKKITKVDDLSVGSAVIWEEEGVTHIGRVTDHADGQVYVQTMDAGTGAAKDLFVIGQWDLDHMGVGQIGDDELPAHAKVPKLPPKPKEPEYPKEIEAPSSTSISKPSDVKIGDHLEWEHNGKTYRGEVVSFEPDGRFRAKVYFPSNASSVGKTPSFDEPKIATRHPRILNLEAIKKYDEEVKARNEKIQQMQSAYAAELKKWTTEKAKIENKKVTAQRPVKKTATPHFPNRPTGWDSNSEAFRLADDLVPIYKEKFKDYFAKQREKLQKAAEQSYFDGTDKVIWDERSVGEKILTRSAHEYGHKFMSEVLTPEENKEWTAHLSAWQGSSGSTGGHKLMGALHAMGIEGDAKPFEQDSHHEQYREEGKNNKVLQRAIAKALAYAQAVYDSLDVKDITLFRGGKSQTSNLKTTKPGQEVTLPKARELTSFSADPQKAYSFGVYRMRAQVPAIRVFISPVTYPALGAGEGSGSGYNENEFILAGLSAVPVKKMPKALADYTPALMKQKKKKVTKKQGSRKAVFHLNDDHNAWHRHMKGLPEMRPAMKLASLAARHPGFKKALFDELRAMVNN